MLITETLKKMVVGFIKAKVPFLKCSQVGALRCRSYDLPAGMSEGLKIREEGGGRVRVHNLPHPPG